MPANTALGFPYPVGTDRVMDGDNAIQNLAQAMNDRAGVCAGGFVTVTPSAANNPATVAVTFPVGRFTAAPYCVASPSTNGPNVCFASTISPTQTGVAVWGVRTNSASAVSIYWLAVQI